MKRRLLPLYEAFYRVKGKISRIAAYSLIWLFFAYGTLAMYLYFMIRQQNSSSEVNTFCRDNPGVSFCQFPEELRFSKFLLFATDCWPISYADDVLDHYKEHSVTYFVDIPGAKYSHAIYTAYLTGQLPTNYKGDPIIGDHLVRSLLRSKEDYKFRYIGPEWSFLSIFGKENYDTFFVDVNIQKETLDIPFQHPYPFFFENNWNFFNDYLQKLKTSGASMFAHSGVFDHRQHGEHRGLGPAGQEWPRTDRMARVMQSDFKAIKDWIDQNPSYLLILLSDHGVDEYGMGGYKMHGESANGNEPFILLYNPTLSSKQEIRIDIVDVAPTLTFYLRGAEIPMNSMGIAQPYLKGNVTSLQMLVLQQNLQQLSAAAMSKGVSLDTKLLDELLSIDLNVATPEDLEKVLTFAKSVKEILYNVMNTPYIQIMYYTLVSSCIVLFVLVQYNEGLDRYVFSSNYLGFAVELWNILAVFGLMFVQLLFCWWNWSFVHNGGVMYRIVSPGLAILMLHQLRKASKAAKITLPESIIYKNEVINIFAMFVTSCFPEVLQFFDQTIPFLGEFMALLGVIAINKYFRRFEPNRKSWETGGFIGCIIAGEFYRYTEESPEYFFYHFHIAAAYIYFFAILVALYYIIVGRINSCIICVDVVLFLLLKDTPNVRFFLMLVNYQYLYCILPLIENLRVEVSYYTFSSRDPHALQPYSLVHQAAVVYALNQIFYSFSFGFGDKINFDVHPFAGRIGIDGYDLYPLLSAFLMSFHKYGMFSLFCIFAFQLVQLKSHPTKEASSSSPNSKPMHHHSSINISHWLSDLMTGALMLFFAMCNLGVYLMFWVATRYHPIEEGTALTMLLGIMGTIYSTLHIIHTYQNRDQNLLYFVDKMEEP